MLSRYSRPEMAAIWSRQEQLRIWFRIEALAVDALADIGRISPDIASRLWAAEPEVFDVERIAAIEATVHHESVAFQTYVTELLDDDIKPHFHFGLTSSDILDTCLSVQLVRSADLLIDGLENLASTLAENAAHHRHALCMGRSHGVHAEPVTFGLKLLRAHVECRRNIHRMKQARSEVAFGKLSGTMGTYTCIDPRVEGHVCEKLGLGVEPVASQIIPRDRHATYFATLAIIASSLERLATEVRFLQVTEIAEVAEGFSARQKGSSAMPHKKNPILSENITGLSRLIRSHVTPALENVALWQERDMSHSSVERFSGPDATTTLDFAIHRMTGIIANLIVDPERMVQNAGISAGAFKSQKIMLALVDKGMDKDEAYRLVQGAAQAVNREGQDLEQRLLADGRITDWMSPGELASLTDIQTYLTYVDLIFDRALAGK